MASEHSRFHPCFSCRLPDCDDGSRHCELRRVLNLQRSLRRRGEPISEPLRIARNLAYRELYGDRHDAREKAIRGMIRAGAGHVQD